MEMEKKLGKREKDGNKKQLLIGATKPFIGKNFRSDCIGD